MAKGIIRTATDAIQTVAGAAIGAAAAAATTVVVESVTRSIQGQKKEYQAPAVESAVKLAIAPPRKSKKKTVKAKKKSPFKKAARKLSKSAKKKKTAVRKKK